MWNVFLYFEMNCDCRWRGIFYFFDQIISGTMSHKKTLEKSKKKIVSAHALRWRGRGEAI